MSIDWSAEFAHIPKVRKQGGKGWSHGSFEKRLNLNLFPLVSALTLALPLTITTDDASAQTAVRAKTDFQASIGEGPNHTLLTIGWMVPGPTLDSAAFKSWEVSYSGDTIEDTEDSDDTVAHALDLIADQNYGGIFYWSQTSFVTDLIYQSYDQHNNELWLRNNRGYIGFWYSDDCMQFQFYENTVYNQELPDEGCVWINTNVQSSHWIGDGQLPSTWLGPAPTRMTRDLIQFGEN